MALITGRINFSSGAVIYAADHNKNDGDIWTDYNGNITNANISASAAITYSKLVLTGGIVNADLSASAAIVASKLILTSPGAIGSVAPSTGAFTTLKVGTTNQGDVLYDNGTSIIRLVPGTSGHYLKTQGAGANPIWAAAGASNVLFSYSGQTDNIGYVAAATLTTAATANYSYWAVVDVGAGYKTVIATKMVKIAGVSTVTIWARIWQSAADSATCRVNIGAANGNVSGTASQTTPEWKTFTVDVSALVNGTTYDVTIQCGTSTNNGVSSYLGSVIGIGS